MHGLNINSVKDRIIGTISTEDALKDTEPLHLPEEVINGGRKMKIVSAEPADDTAGLHVRIK